MGAARIVTSFANRVESVDLRPLDRSVPINIHAPAGEPNGLNSGNDLEMSTILRAKGILLLTLLLAACGGGGSGEKSREAIGKFQAGGVKGLRYNTLTRAGVTDAGGSFTYVPGEKVTISVGGIELGSVPAGDNITPFTLAGIEPPVTERALRTELDRATRQSTPFTRAINIQQLLIALDADHDPNNGLDVESRASLLANSGIDFDLSVNEFAARLQKLAPGLTRDVPPAWAVAYLYRGLNIQVPVRATTFSVTSDDKSAVAGMSFRTYGSNGERATEGEDSNNDGIPENVRSWTYDAQGRVASEEVVAGGGPTRERYRYAYQYDARGAFADGRERLDVDDDGIPEQLAQRTAAVDAFGFRTGLRVDQDQDADGIVDARDTIEDGYDERHNRVRSATVSDAGADSVADSLSVNALSYDDRDRKLSDRITGDDNADGIADNDFVENFEYFDASRSMRRTSEQDLDGDGSVDFRYVSISTFDESGNEISRVEEFDNDADGMPDQRQMADFTYDGAARLKTQRFREDAGADGIIDSDSNTETTYDDAGNAIEQIAEYDFDNDGTVDSRFHLTASVGEGGGLTGYQNTSYDHGAVPLYVTDTAVASELRADGVLLLAQQYFGY